METTILSFLRRIGYKDIFNYLYSTKYKDSLSFEEITSLDSQQRRFYDQLIISQPEEVMEALDLSSFPEGEDPVILASDLFLKLYLKPNHSLKWLNYSRLSPLLFLAAVKPLTLPADAQEKRNANVKKSARIVNAPKPLEALFS